MLGAAVGGLIAGGVALRIEAKRDERDRERRKVEVRAAARLVFTDLEVARLALEHALAQEKVIGTNTVPTAAWRAHGVLLAAALPSDDYDAVAEACAKVAVWVCGVGGMPTLAPGLVPDIDLSENPDARGAIENLLGMCLRAREILHRIAYGPERSEEDEQPAR